MSLAHHAHTRRHKHCCYSYSCNDRVSLITHQDGFDSVLCASDQCRGTVPAVTRFCVICSCSWVAGGTPPELQCHTLSSLSPHLLSPSFIPPFFFSFISQQPSAVQHSGCPASPPRPCLSSVFTRLPEAAAKPKEKGRSENSEGKHELEAFRF